MGSWQRSEAGSHKITPEPRTTASTSSRSVNVIAVYGLIEKPGADAFVRQCEAMNQEAIDVGPVNRGMRRMPDRTFRRSGRRSAPRKLVAM